MAYKQSCKTQYDFKGSLQGKLLGTLFSGRMLEIPSDISLSNPYPHMHA